MGVGRAPQALPARTGGRVAFPRATPLPLSNHLDLAAFTFFFPRPIEGLWTSHLEEQWRLLPRCPARTGRGSGGDKGRKGAKRGT